MLTALQTKVDNSEECMTAHIGQQIDGLETRLAARIDRGKREVVNIKRSINTLNKENADLINYVGKKFPDMPAMINKMKVERLVGKECRPPALRSRPARGQDSLRITWGLAHQALPMTGSGIQGEACVSTQ